MEKHRIWLFHRGTTENTYLCLYSSSSYGASGLPRGRVKAPLYMVCSYVHAFSAPVHMVRQAGPMDVWWTLFEGCVRLAPWTCAGSSSYGAFGGPCGRVMDPLCMVRQTSPVDVWWIPFAWCVRLTPWTCEGSSSYDAFGGPCGRLMDPLCMVRQTSPVDVWRLFFLWCVRLAAWTCEASSSFDRRTRPPCRSVHARCGPPLLASARLCSPQLASTRLFTARISREFSNQISRHAPTLANLIPSKRLNFKELPLKAGVPTTGNVMRVVR